MSRGIYKQFNDKQFNDKQYLIVLPDDCAKLIRCAPSLHIRLDEQGLSHHALPQMALEPLLAHAIKVARISAPEVNVDDVVTCKEENMRIIKTRSKTFEMLRGKP